MNEIFLSYKRSDDPGYVARLADSLQRKFGEGTVYRDVDNTRAGGNWRKIITRSVSGAEVVLALIGPDWQKLVSGHPAEELEWVSFELNQARSLDVPIIPVRLDHTVWDDKQDLGDLNWFKDLQAFRLGDGQGRWEADVERLAGEIARTSSSLEIIENAQEKAGSVSQASHGKQSPNIVSTGGPVTITFGKDSD